MVWKLNDFYIPRTKYELIKLLSNLNNNFEYPKLNRLSKKQLYKLYYQKRKLVS